jgi:selT/selW/selH-like putative selenoprotein
VFDVTVDGELVYSKHDSYRFPTNEEVFARIRERQRG